MDYKDLCPYCMEEKGGREVCPLCGYSEPGSDEPSIFLPPRTVLYDKYLIGRVLGQGGFGITYLAWDINLDIKIAVKEFFPQGLVSRGPTSKDVVSFSGDVKKQFEFGLERFLHEARTLARFADHPNIVTVRDFFRANGTAYMVMNYIEGMTLEEYLEQAGGMLAFKETLDIMMPVLDALKEVHLAGILHRDISPDNIFIDASGRVVLIDFGAARQEMQQKSRGLSVIMKAGYAPEEQYRTRGEQGPWTDVYAAAATMYRSLTGQIPMESMDRLAEDVLVPPSGLGADIEPHQEEALLKAMALRARDRYRNIEEFQVKLLQEEPGETKAEGLEVTAEAELVKEEEKRTGSTARQAAKPAEDILLHEAEAEFSPQAEESEPGLKVEQQASPERKLKAKSIIFFLAVVALIVFARYLIYDMPAAVSENGNFTVDPTTNTIAVHEWPNGTELNVFIKDPEGPTWAGTITTDAGGDYWLFVGDEFDIDTGHLIRVDDGSTVKEHTVTELRIVEVDWESNTISGVAQPGSEVEVCVYAHPDPVRLVTADDEGSWTVDFSEDAGAEPQLLAYDIGIGTAGNANQRDQGGDETHIYWEIEGPLEEPAEEGAEPEYETPTNYIESIDAEVVELLFFESGDDVPDWGQRTYDTRFSRTEARFINWELDLKHPAPGERKYFEITYIYYYPGGNVMGDHTFETYIESYWDNSQHTWNWGWPDPGHWITGTYYVEIIVDGEVVASGEFEIY